MANPSKFSLSYFRYFYKIIGKHIYAYFVLNLFIGLLDGFGLTMFVPILQAASGQQAAAESLGNLAFILDFFRHIGLPLTLLNGLIIMVLLFAFKGVAIYVRTVYFTRLRQKASLRLQTEMIADFERISYEGYTRLDAGKIQSAVITQTREVVQAMTIYFTVFQEIVMIIACLYIAVSVNWKFALLVAAGAWLSNLLFNRINRVTRDLSRRQVKVNYNINGELIQTVQHFKYLKATARFGIFVRRLLNNIVLNQQYFFRLTKLNALVSSIKEPLVITVIALVTAVQVYVFGSNFATMLVALLMFYRAMNYAVHIQTAWNSFIGTSAAMDSVEEMRCDFARWQEPQNIAQIAHINDITLQNVGVRFGERTVLDNISLHIPHNATVAFVGESGAGKTTLANVVSGLQTPHNGQALAGNSDIYRTNLADFRQKVGYITQEAVIFDDTIFNNVTFWAAKTPETLSRFWNVMQMTAMTYFVKSTEKQEDTPLGQNGVLISGGQKQRISIARELYREVELLVMDEATSALDSETETHIRESIELLQGKFTMVIIAHRLSTIKNADTIYLLENGKIAASGTFAALLQQSDKFRRMVELQEL